MENSKEHADKEKRKAAGSSVLAAVFLTGMKIVVGFATGSLGILAEAAHSALDLVAAVITFVAVKAAGQPADSEHTYGHGKVENLSALFETFLLLVTCIWIIYEACRRLSTGHLEIEASWWAFLVIVVSIVVDYSRSRMLQRTAEKYNSQALEADALHFSTDIWSSLVVLLGLLCVSLSQKLGMPSLLKADALAALGVSLIVIYVSFVMGRKTITALLDGVPAKMRDEIAKIVKVPGVLDVKRVRVRQSGSETFVDIILAIDRKTEFEYAHSIASQAENAVQNLVPGADVLVHLEPGDRHKTGTIVTLKHLASQYNLSIHAVRLYDLPDGYTLELHLEMSENLQVAEAHKLATDFEDRVCKAIPSIKRVITHLEPKFAQDRNLAPIDPQKIQKVVEEVVQKETQDCQPHDLRLESAHGKISLSFHCTLDGKTKLVDAHNLTDRIEHALYSLLPNLDRVYIHIEPPE